VGPVLNDALFTPHKTVVCVSATLGLGGSFDYWLERAGLAGREDVLRGTFASPFPYKQAVLLAIPADAPPPSSPAYQGFVNDAALRLCTASGGGALVLFTSYGSLRAAFSFCAPRLARHGICALAQGEDDRARLMRRFLDDASSVLFATDSFWEGIDAPGETLRLVILCRLPFNTPDDPVPQARCEALERAGKNPFTELSVPEAVMKFRQGFGRLMRRASDRGVVAVLDNRLAQKSYGRIFLDALPETRRCVDSFEVVERVCEQFLNM
ncbi:MAG: ATP-dependent DNA helicase DinG, partial [Spirochaetaceae bacterium]|jgi:ATP-dependent DNA helicase DinG|nr:ATP-dependent DNA helicase DinG [Spirochaetaceae bacterium]